MRHSAKAVARLEKERQAAQRREDRSREDRSREARRQPAGQATGSKIQQAMALAPYWIILFGVAGGLAAMHGGERDVRSGTLVTAGVLLAAAAARLVLPERRAGMLGSRRRLVDVVAFAALGIGLLVSGLVFPVPV